NVDHAHHVGVADQRREPRLVAEHVAEVAILEQMRMNALEHDEALEARRAELPRDVDRGHPARCQLEERLVRSESKARDGVTHVLVLKSASRARGSLVRCRPSWTPRSSCSSS